MCHCELIAERTGTRPRVLDMWLWNSGQAPRNKAIPRHPTRNSVLLSYAALPVWTTPPFESTTPSAQEASTRPSWNCSW